MAANATQSFVPVQEVRNGVIILKDGGLRSILMASSVNFALKGEDEQNAIVGAFQTFLNTTYLILRLCRNISHWEHVCMPDFYGIH